MKTGENQYMFALRNIRDSVTITFFVDIDSLRHNVYQTKKKIGK